MVLYFQKESTRRRERGTDNTIIFIQLSFCVFKAFLKDESGGIDILPEQGHLQLEVSDNVIF